MEIKDFLDRYKSASSEETFYISEPDIAKGWNAPAEDETTLDAIYTGIGSGEDLFASKKELPVALSFSCQSRLEGVKQETYKVYPEIPFQYEVHYEGEIADTYQEQKYEMQVDAYPVYKLGFEVTQTAEMPVIAEGEVQLTMKGIVPKEEVRYRLEYEIAQENENPVSLENLFSNTGSASYIGPDSNGTGLSAKWVYNNEKKRLQAKANLGAFSGTMLKGSFLNKKDCSATFTYQVDSESDDLIGFVFRAQSVSDFYLLLMEGEERTEGYRISERLGEAGTGQININEEEVSMDGDFWVQKKDKDDEWFKKNAGWKERHKRLFRVQNGIIKLISSTAKNGNNKGYEKREVETVRIVCTGKTAEIYHNGEGLPSFKISDCAYESGSFGVVTVSQAFDLIKIELSEMEIKKGKYPENGWSRYSGVGENEPYPRKTGKEIVQEVAESLAEKKPHIIKSVKAVVDPSCKGTASATLNGPLKVNAMNGESAGNDEEWKYEKSIRYEIDPLKKKKEDVTVPEDLNELFKDEIASFSEKNPLAKSIEKEFLVKKMKVTGESEEIAKQLGFLVDRNRLFVWCGSFPKEVNKHAFQATLASYEGWKPIASMNVFPPHRYAVYTAAFDSKEAELGETIKLKWASGAQGKESRVFQDELYAFTETVYEGEYEGEQYGFVTSLAEKKVAMPKRYKHISKNEWFFENEDMEPETVYTRSIDSYLETDVLLLSDINGDIVNLYLEGSDLEGMGSMFESMEKGVKNIEGKRINMLFLSACAVYATSMKLSKEQKEKKNLFHSKEAYASSMMKTYESFEACTEDFCKSLIKNYLEPLIKENKKTTVGEIGENLFSSPEWKHEVAAIMKDIEQKKKDYKKIPIVSVHYLLEAMGETKGNLIYGFESEKPVTNESKALKTNERTKEPILMTEKRNDWAIVSCKPRQKIRAWKSDVIRETGKVNGKTPYTNKERGKQSMIKVDVQKMPIPDGVMNLRGPFVKVMDERVSWHPASIRQVNFSSQYQEELIIEQKWFGEWSESSETYVCTETGCLIEQPPSLNAQAAQLANPGLVIDSVRVVTDNPYVYAEGLIRPGENERLHLKVYESKNRVKPEIDQWKCKGTYKETLIEYIVKDTEISEKPPVAVTQWISGGMIAKSSAQPSSLDFACDIEVVEGEELLVVAGQFEDSSLLHYCDLHIFSPIGESFGYSAENGTWSLDELETMTFDDASPIQSCTSYMFSGETESSEYMKFTSPHPGIWKVYVYNPFSEMMDYEIYTSNQDTEPKISLLYEPFEENIQIKKNGTLLEKETDYKVKMTESEVEFLPAAAIAAKDILEISYLAGGEDRADLELYELDLPADDVSILFVEKDQKPLTSAQYEKEGKILRILDSEAKKSGVFEVCVAKGTKQRDFLMRKPVYSNPVVMLNQDILEEEYYEISEGVLSIKEEVEMEKGDYVTLISYQSFEEKTPEEAKTGISLLFEDETENIDYDSLTLATAGVSPLLFDIPLEEEESFSYSVRLQVSHESMDEPAVFRKEKEVTLKRPYSDLERTLKIDETEAIGRWFEEEINRMVMQLRLSSDAELEMLFTVEEEETSSVWLLKTEGPSKTADSKNAKICYLMKTIPIESEKKIGDASKTSLKQPVIVSASVPSSADKPKPVLVDVIESGMEDENKHAHYVFSGYMSAPKMGTYEFKVLAKGPWSMRLGSNTFRMTEESKFVTKIGNTKPQRFKLHVLVPNNQEGPCKLLYKTGKSGWRVVPKSWFSTRFGYGIKARLKRETPKPWRMDLVPGYYYLNEREFYLYGNKKRQLISPVSNQIILYPAPAEYGKILVRNEQGVLFRCSPCYKGSMHDAAYEEEIRGEEAQVIPFRFQHIETSEIIVKLNKIPLTVNEEYVIRKNRIHILQKLDTDDRVFIRCPLKNVFTVEKNEDTNSATLSLHGEVSETMEAVWEIGEMREVEELEFHPMLTNHNKGFLVVSHAEEAEAEEVEISASPKEVSIGSNEPVLVIAKVMDKKGNPLREKQASIKKNGSVVASGKTNQAGEISFLDKEASSEMRLVRYVGICESIQEEKVVRVFDPMLSSRRWIRGDCEKTSLKNPETETVKFTLESPHGVLLSGTDVKIRIVASDGSVVSQTMMTNSEGFVTVDIVASEYPKGNITVEGSHDMETETTVSQIKMHIR